MARAYASPFLYEHRMGEGEDTDHGLLDGALFVRLSKAGVPSILIEAGGGLPPRPRPCDAASRASRTCFVSSDRRPETFDRKATHASCADSGS